MRRQDCVYGRPDGLSDEPKNYSPLRLTSGDNNVRISHDDMSSIRLTTLASILSELSSLDRLKGNFVSAFCFEYNYEYFLETIRFYGSVEEVVAMCHV